MGVLNPHHPSTIRRSTQPNWYLFARAAAHSRKPHYLLHSLPGVMDRGWRRNCASAASRSSAGCARDCRQSIAWHA
jgi:hypothetical protein